MSDDQPIRGGFVRGFLVGTLASLLVTVGLSIGFPLDGQSILGPSTPPDVVVDVPTVRSSLGAETSGLETPAVPEPTASAVEPAPVQVAPEPVPEPAEVTLVEPAAVDTASPVAPVVAAEVTAEATVQPALQGFSADVTTPTTQVAQAPTRTSAQDVQASELNEMLPSPDMSVEPMIPLEPIGGALTGELDLGELAPSEANFEPMIPLENSGDIQPDIAADAELLEAPIVTEMAGAELAEQGIIAVEDAPAEVVAPVAEGTPDAPSVPGSATAEGSAAVEPTVEAASEAAPAVDGATVAPAVVVASGALAKNATAYEDNGERPLLAVILVDAGASGQDIAKLAELGMPLTIGILSDVPGAIERTAEYRAAGFEVVAIAPKAGVGAFRRGQNTEEIPLQLEAIFSAVPEAVAVMDPPGGELPKDNQLVRAVLAGLQPTGHALLTQAGGFNSVGDLAAEAGVFSQTVMRQIEGIDAVNFAMSRAALQAGKTGSAVIMANTSPDMVKEVVQWLLSPSARSVALAPVSAALVK